MHGCEIHSTQDIGRVNKRIRKASTDPVHLHGTFDVGETPIKIPSDTTVINWGTLRQKDDTPGRGTNILQNTHNSDPTTTDTNITFINHGIIDGNCENQEPVNENRHAIHFKEIDNLEFHGVHVVDPVDFCMQVEYCTQVRFSDFYAEVNTPQSHQDGLHFADCNDVHGYGVSGVSEDDLLAITADQRDVSDIAITNVQGHSINADLIRLNKAIALHGDGEDKTLRNIQILNANGHDLGASGVVLTGDANTSFENVSIQAHIDRANHCGLTGSSDCSFKNCTFDLTIRDPEKQGVLLGGEVRNCDFDVVYDGGDVGAPFIVKNALSSNIDISAEYEGDAPNVHVLSGDSVQLDVNLNGGGRGVQFGSSKGAVTNSTATGIARGIRAETAVELADTGCRENTVDLHGDCSASAFEVVE